MEIDFNQIDLVGEGQLDRGAQEGKRTAGDDDRLAEGSQKRKKGAKKQKQREKCCNCIAHNVHGLMRSNAREWLKRESSALVADEEGALKLVGSRHSLVLRMRYFVYDSPSPALFVREARSLYLGATEDETSQPLSPDWAQLESTCSAPEARNDDGSVSDSRLVSAETYFSIVLVSQNRDRAMRVAHHAVLDVHLRETDGRGGNVWRCITHNVFVKLAQEDEEVDALRNEYAIYQHLAAHDVEGVPVVLGLFRDVEEDGPLMLVMTDVGVPLRWRSERLRITEAQGDAFICALTSIHAAGILHGDIHPKSLLVDAAGKVAIVNFKCAEESTDQTDREMELERLSEYLLDFVGDGFPVSE
ncbi:hypothetical protein DFH11DRAFT_1242956 [Phellopilus nigrolimitatus]|nr:hypothetical protein DFH11DRAFT_1242956 [Phellopilus nigrolimitatus]